MKFETEDLTKKINDSKAYYIEGDLEIVNNEDVGRSS